MSKQVKWITRTALFIALIIVIQIVTKTLSTFVTGSLVNLILIIAGTISGLSSGVVVALISPILAFLFGIAPQVYLVPFIAAGNLVIVIATNLFINSSLKFTGAKKYLAQVAGIVVGAVAKFLVLYIGIVKILLPSLTNLKAPQVEKMTAMFSWPQLVTALIGGFIALLILPTLKKALSNNNQ
mgnify:CR=1 FL=1